MKIIGQLQGESGRHSGKSRGRSPGEEGSLPCGGIRELKVLGEGTKEGMVLA